MSTARRILTGLLLTVVLLAVPATLFLSGKWVPNEPAELRRDRATATTAARPARGIDVSRHQGEIDWARVAASGQVDFVYVKATEGRDWTDPAFARNWREAGKAGIRRGAYHFFTFRSSGAEQARHFIATVPKEPGALPPAVDLEFYGNSPRRPPVGEFRRELETFLARLRDHYGTEPVVYTMHEFHRVYLKDHPTPRLWMREVAGRPSGFARDRWLFWQYSAFGSVPGINGPVDQNLFRGTRAELDTLATGG
jgi:lysozyme